MSNSMAMAAVSLQKICKNFGGLKAVSDVTLSVMPGERRLIIGTNGAGKTTVFNLISGELLPSSGTVKLFGEDVSKLPVHKRTRYGMRRTYQTSALFNEMTIWEHLFLALLGCESMLKQLNVFRTARRNKLYNEKIKRAAVQFGLGDKLEVKAAELSHGERRQLELCTAAITESRILLFDEPSSGLSTEERKQIIKIIQELDRRITVIIIEHDMEVAFALADFVTVMFDGKVITEGDPDTIKNDPLVKKIYLGANTNV